MATHYRRVIYATDGTEFDLDSCAHTYTYNADGTIATDTAFNGAHYFVMTYAYASGKLMSKSAWVRQA